MSRKLEEATSGSFYLTKSIALKGSTIRTYSSKGFLYYDQLNEDFPAVRLEERDGGIWMSDTPFEQEGLKVPVAKAFGDVLTIGLGIGLFPTLLRKNKKVKSILIIEQSADVITLVYDKIKWEKTSIIHGDGEEWLKAFTFTTFDFIFIDIWEGFTGPMKDIEKWYQLAKPCLNPGGIIYCWLQELYDRIKDKLPKGAIKRPGPPAIYPPCLICGKKLRNDYAGLCMDCADNLELSEIYSK